MFVSSITLTLDMNTAKSAEHIFDRTGKRDVPLFEDDSVVVLLPGSSPLQYRVLV